MGKRKDMFGKGNMTRYMNTSSEEIEAAIAFVFVGKTEKNTWDGSWREFIG